MLRSMYSGVSGMRNFQTKMDVIANNIANVNTTAFKSGRASFQDIMSQTVATAQSPQGAGGRGGVNAQQIGLGVRVGSIDTIMENGAPQPTNRGLDFAIAGEGFFTVSPDGGATKLYTRDGAFYADHEGNLVNSAGFTIMGFGPARNADGTYIDNFKTKEEYDGKVAGKAGGYFDPAKEQIALKIPEKLNDTFGEAADGKYELQSYNVDGNGIITGVYKKEGTPAIVGPPPVDAVPDDVQTIILGEISLTTFANPGGLTKNGGNNYTYSNNSGDPQVGQAGTGSKGTILQGFLEMSNVDLANEFTEMIVTSRAYQANSRSITTSDEMIQELLNLKR